MSHLLTTVDARIDTEQRQRVRQSDFARIAGVSRAAIAKALRRLPLSDAMRGMRIDPNNDGALAYLAKHPLPRDSNGCLDPAHIPDGLFRAGLAPVGGQTPHLPRSLRFRLLLTRALGRIPSADDLETHAFLSDGDGLITVKRVSQG